MMLSASLILPALLALAAALGLGDADDKTLADFDNDWATYHLALEHHLDNFDAGAFFSLHDFDGNGGWSPADVRRMYGLEHESARDVGEDRREEVTRDVFALFDADHNGVIERDEFFAKTDEGVRMPDFGVSSVSWVVQGGLTRCSWGRGTTATTSTSMRSLWLTSCRQQARRPDAPGGH
jgi:hypothetical protein